MPNRVVSELQRWILLLLYGIAAVAASVVPASAQDVKTGDLFVGADRPDGGGGAIYRVRGKTVTLFCQPEAGKQWSNPGQILVDAEKRVAALVFSSDGGMEMVRCSTAGGVPEKLGFFQIWGGSEPPPDWPVPYPGMVFVSAVYGGPSGFHLAKQISVTSDDSNGYVPRLSTGEIYQFLYGSNSDIFLLRYHADTQLWDDAQGGQPGITYLQPPDMTTHGASRYYVQTNLLHRIKLPLNIQISGKAGGLDFNLSLSLFGSEGDLSAAILDDTTIPNIDSGCDGKDGYPTDLPELWRFAGFGVVYDTYNGNGLMVANDSGTAGTPYLTNVSESLFDDPNNKAAYFHNPNIGCAVFPRVFFGSIMPFSNPNPPFNTNILGTGRLGKVMAATKKGIFGTQNFANRVVSIVPGGDRTVKEVVGGILSANGIAAYPTDAGTGGLMVMIRLDSPITALITDPNGKKLGVDPVTGALLNDFGDAGFDSGPGEPRIFGISNATPGHFTVQVTGTDTGSYKVHTYSTDLLHPTGHHIKQTGKTNPGLQAFHDFVLKPTGGIQAAPH